jgi:hypothetical protein
MRQIIQTATKLSLVLFASATLTVTGCGSSGSSNHTDGASGDGGGGLVLLPSATGFLDGSVAGVLGPWYAYGDGYATDGTAMMGMCETVGMNPPSACSSLIKPTPGAPVVPDDLTTGKICTAGTAAQVIGDVANTTADYSNIFGDGMAFDFNNPGADADGGAPAQKPFYDAAAHGITGISFTLDGDNVPIGHLRVEFPTAAMRGVTDLTAAFWTGGNPAAQTSPVVMGTNTIKWGDVQGPFYITSPAVFDKMQLLSMQFHVWTDLNPARPFSYCVSNITLLTN